MRCNARGRSGRSRGAGSTRRSLLVSAPDEDLPSGTDPAFLRTLLAVQRLQEAALRESDELDALQPPPAGPDWVSTVVAREHAALAALVGVPLDGSACDGAVALQSIDAASSLEAAPASLRFRLQSAAAAATALPVLTSHASAVTRATSTAAMAPGMSPRGPPSPTAAADSVTIVVTGTPGNSRQSSAADRAALFRRMYPPGRLLHMAKVGEAPTDLASAACTGACGARPSRRQLAVADCLARVFCCCVRRVRSVYEPRWTRRANLGRIRVAPTAAADHMPDKVWHVLRQAVADARNARGGTSRWLAAAVTTGVFPAAAAPLTDCGFASYGTTGLRDKHVDVPPWDGTGDGCGAEFESDSELDDDGEARS